MAAPTTFGSSQGRDGVRVAAATYATAVATLDPQLTSPVRQLQILNPLRWAGIQTQASIETLLDP